MLFMCSYVWFLSVVLGIIAAAVLVVTLLLLIFLVNRLRIAIALIKEASR